MHNNPYSQRSNNVQVLGFRSYEEYLASALWRSIKARVLKTAAECLSCGARATALHHTAYDLDTLRGNSTSSLVPTCRRCHNKAEHIAAVSRTDPYDKLASATLALLTGEFKSLKQSNKQRQFGLSATLKHTRRVAVAAFQRTKKPHEKARTKWNRACVSTCDMTPRLVKNEKSD